jgi:hypothetical protein
MSYLNGLFRPDKTVRYLLTINPAGDVVLEEASSAGSYVGDMVCGTAWNVFMPALREKYPLAIFLPERVVNDDPGYWFDGAILWSEVADTLSSAKSTVRRRVYRAQATAHRHAYMPLERYLSPGPGDSYVPTELATECDISRIDSAFVAYSCLQMNREEFESLASLAESYGYADKAAVMREVLAAEDKPARRPRRNKPRTDDHDDEHDGEGHEADTDAEAGAQHDEFVPVTQDPDPELAGQP